MEIASRAGCAGPGYRIYYGKDGEYVILLLCGGDKGSQERDIDCWRDYQRRIV